jgi:hypothetical protein
VILGADNVSLNLAGHTITGQSFPNSGPPPPQGAGVLIGGHHGVTVRNGTITGYVNWSPFRGISVSRDGVDAGTPAPPGGGQPTLANRNRILALTTSDPVTLIGNHNLIAFERSGPTGGLIRVMGRHNRVARSGVERTCLSGFAGPGLSIEADGTSNIIDHDVACSIMIGFHLGSGGDANTVQDNTVIDGPIVSDGGELGADNRYVTISGERIIGNRVRDNVPFGAEIGGIYLFDTSARLVYANRLLYSGITLAQSYSAISGLGTYYPSIDDDRLVLNHVSQVQMLNGGGPGVVGDGIDIPGPSPNGSTMFPGARRTLVARNTTDRNANDGIDNGAPSTIFRANVANHNANLGIESAAGAVDLGANRATGNGNPAQCTHVECR